LYFNSAEIQLKGKKKEQIRNRRGEVEKGGRNKKSANRRGNQSKFLGKERTHPPKRHFLEGLEGRKKSTGKEKKSGGEGVSSHGDVGTSKLCKSRGGRKMERFR